MALIEFGEPKIGEMGLPVPHEYYRCPHCKMSQPSYDGTANLLAQRIDREILNRIIATVM